MKWNIPGDKPLTNPDTVDSMTTTSDDRASPVCEVSDSCPIQDAELGSLQSQGMKKFTIKKSAADRVLESLQEMVRNDDSHYISMSHVNNFLCVHDPQH